MKQYIGDSVYVSTDDYGVTLTTENGMGASNTIYLESEVAESLVKVLEEWLVSDD